jgi:hypothetical protein
MTRAELLQATMKEIRYEVLMLLDAHDCYYRAKLKRDWSSKSDQERDAAVTLCNVSLESFLLHYRNLDEFLHNMGHNDSVNARDYADTWIFQRKTKGNPNANHHPRLASDDEIKRIHKRLAHISAERSTLDRQWNIPQMQEQVCSVFEEFVKAVPLSAPKEFDEAVQAIQRRRVHAMQPLLSSWDNSTATPRTIGTLTLSLSDHLKIIK